MIKRFQTFCFCFADFHANTSACARTASPGVCDSRNQTFGCRRSSSGTLTCFYLRLIEVGRCRSLQQSWRDDDSQHLEDRCHHCLQQRASGTTRTGGGRTSKPGTPTAGPDTQREREGERSAQRDGCAGHKVVKSEGAVVCCLYPQTTATPLPLESLPPKFVGPLQPPPYSQRSSTSQKLNHTGCSPLLQFPQRTEKVELLGRWKGAIVWYRHDDHAVSTLLSNNRPDCNRLSEHGDNTQHKPVGHLTVCKAPSSPCVWMYANDVSPC